MKFEKVIDEAYTQVYHVVEPSKEWLKRFPCKTTIITYNPNTAIIKSKNTNAPIDISIVAVFSYVFTTIPPAAIKSVFKGLPFDTPPKLRKHCGLNGCEQSLYSEKNNTLISLFSLPKYEYPPTYIRERINIVASYDEIMNIDDKLFDQVVGNIFVKSNSKIKSLIDFVDTIKERFPFNYMLTVRRFHKTLTNDSFKNPKPLGLKHFYIGYDMRYGDLIKENKLIKRMESLAYNDKDDILVYETYNNPMKTIIKQCEDKQIKYTEIHKHCIKLKMEDYLKLNLVSKISDFV